MLKSIKTIFSSKQKESNNDTRYTPFRLESLENLLIGCRLTKEGISVILSKEDDIKYTKEQITEAVKNEIEPYINDHLKLIEEGI